MAKTRLQDVFSGHDGEAFIRLNGSIVPAFKISKITAKLEAVVENRRFLNDPMEQAAQRGLKGSGDMTYYHTTPALIRAARDYKNGGEAPDISLQFYSDSKSSKLDRISVTLSGVILANVGFGALDDGSDNAQTIDTSFTFNDFDLA
ncbi:phage tail tube protein [Faecalispora jeddahensis]|uniref:phage tail tube protein n=1 Tax=Faecalispora jeddahensis TaxID=1414721 RepID=UPI0004B5D756|nr:phage tail tube protein [Faecalispora jeddahensis]